MGDALVSALAGTIVNNLESLARREFRFVGNLKTHLGNLKSTLTTIQAVLEDAERKQWQSKAVNDWLRKLKDVAYDVDDILDEVDADVLRRKARESMTSQVSAFFSADQNPVVFNLKMARKVKKISERLFAVAKEKADFHLTERDGNVDVDVVDREGRQTDSLVPESETFGRHGEKESIIGVLLSGSRDENDLSIYAIGGMGGLGKTTLAQLVYNDERVKGAFDLRIWVCVSDDFQIKRLIKAIIESIDERSCDLQELDPLQRHLQQRLGGRRFLLVLDDVWNKQTEKWEMLRNPLSYGEKGSMVLVTTRNKEVALIMATATPTIHWLSYLSEEDSWKLFKQRAFGKRREEEYIHLEAIGKEIVKKCGGVPLAIKALGSLLRLKQREIDWLDVKNSEIWDLDGEKSRILPALRLSYDKLPSYLRACFAYCSIFPKDSVMQKSLLIELWIANGLVHTEGEKEMRKVGDKIFTELSSRFFFQDVEEDSEGEVKCRMHDLIHDLASSIMRYESFVVGGNRKSSEFPEGIRHLHVPWIRTDDLLWSTENLSKSRSLRTLITRSAVPHSSFSKFKQLRALYLDGFQGERLPESICNMIHLRYLNLSETSIRRLPESIGNLIHLGHLNLSRSPIERLPESIGNLIHLGHLNLSWSHIERLPESIGNLIHLGHLNLSRSRIKRLPESTSRLQELKVLNLNGSRLEQLPKNMRHMRNLSCLHIRRCYFLKQMPPAMGDLRHLQVLDRFIVGKDIRCEIGELKELNLGEELQIEGLDNVTSLREADSANLMGKQKLQSLELIWNAHAENIPENVEEVLSGLRPHSNLERLWIVGYQGLLFPDWMIDMPHLVSLDLDGCRRCSLLPPLGRLPLLKSLEIGGMDAVKHIDSEFPSSLQTVKLWYMPNLEKWTTVNERENFPCLRSLTLLGCPKLVELPNFPSLKKLGIMGSNISLIRPLTCLTTLKISHIPSMTAAPDGLLQNHTLLEELTIQCQPDLKSLSNLQLDNLSALRDLSILDCKELTSLPDQIEYLTSLFSLEISDCPNLMSLPHGLQSLTSLKILQIYGSPQLERRCEKEKGEDWPKIAHIRSRLFH